MIEILSRGRKGTLDWETERVSPRPLRSQLKLYQPVENSVNENCTASIDLARKICAIVRDSRHRPGRWRVFRHVTKGHRLQKFSFYVITPFEVTLRFHEQNRRTWRPHMNSLNRQGVRCLQKMLEIGRLVGKMGDIPSMQQQAVPPFGRFIRAHRKFAFTVSIVTANSG